MPFKKTEIIATIGPASIGLLDRLYDAGMNGVRVNSSHGTHDFHRSVIEESRKVNPSGYIIYDIKGPKIRLGDIPEPLPVKAGDHIVLRTDITKPDGSDYPAVRSASGGIPVTFHELDRYVRPGHRLFIDDAYVGLEVLDAAPGAVTCRVMYGDIIRSRKGLNHPDTVIGYPYTMPQDLPDLNFAIASGADFIADSFTRSGEDVLELRKLLEEKPVRIISKICISSA